MARAHIAKVSNAIVVGALLSVSGIAESAPFPAPLLDKSVAAKFGAQRTRDCLVSAVSSEAASNPPM